MRINIRIAGVAGSWMNSTADIIAWVFADLGYSVITDIEYQSLIKWGLNYFDINVSDEHLYTSKYVDILVALDEKNLLHSVPSVTNTWVVISNSKSFKKIEEKGIILKAKTLLWVDIEDKYDNTYLLGVLSKILSLDDTLMEKSLTEVFKKKGDEIVQKNIEIYRNIKQSYPAEVFLACWKVWEAKKISYGNKMLALWALDTWLWYYAAYPMTPASSVLTEMVKANRCTVLQAEDEIAVMNSALWASYTGTRSMVWTSWGGFALMTEAISFAIQGEIPITAILAQRAGPSTWTPTFNEQWDINFALNPSFWDFQHIVITPSTLEDGYYLSGQALNLAEKYQTVVIVLIDKLYADGKVTLGELQGPWIIKWKFLDTPPVDYKRYELTEDGISPMVQVGTVNGDFIATSYEHDEFWATTEEVDMKIKMTEKRSKKLDNFFEKEGIYGFEVFNQWAKKMLVTTNFIAYNAREFVKQYPEFGLIVIKFLKPLDARLLTLLQEKQEVIFVEYNYSGQLENYIVKELWLRFVNGLKISSMRRYDLLPFHFEDFIERLLPNG